MYICINLEREHHSNTADGILPSKGPFESAYRRASRQCCHPPRFDHRVDARRFDGWSSQRLLARSKGVDSGSGYFHEMRKGRTALSSGAFCQ